MTIQEITKIHLRKAATPGKNYTALDTDGIVKTWRGQSDGGLRLLGAVSGQQNTSTEVFTREEAMALFYPLNTNPAGYLTSVGAETDPAFTLWLSGPPNLSEFFDDVGYLTGNQTITLSGDVSGSGTTSISVVIGAGKVTNAMLAGSIDNAKLVNSSITMNGTPIPLGGSVSGLAVTTDKLNQFASTSSSELASVISDEVGSGALVFKSYVDDKIDYNLAICNALGSVIKAETEPMQYVNANTNPADGTLYIQAIWLSKSSTLTGVKFYQRTQGSYTADNNNKIGLYTYSSGTLTLVASCADDGNLWKGTTNSLQTKAFSSTYAASEGLYFIGILYNNSAVVTAPALGTITNFTNLAQSSLDFTNSAKLCSLLLAQTDLPATQAMSGLTANTIRFWLALY